MLFLRTEIPLMPEIERDYVKPNEAKSIVFVVLYIDVGDENSLEMQFFQDQEQ